MSGITEDTPKIPVGRQAFIFAGNAIVSGRVVNIYFDKGICASAEGDAARHQGHVYIIELDSRLSPYPDVALPEKYVFSSYKEANWEATENWAMQKKRDPEYFSERMEHAQQSFLPYGLTRN